eukprot:m.105553 g.105553  ORF g.105553 m.105553 type:complete len:57 (+) comp15723_c0_seq3:192-362(+)
MFVRHPPLLFRTHQTRGCFPRRVMGIAMKMAQDQLSSPPAPHSTAPDQPMSVKTQW